MFRVIDAAANACRPSETPFVAAVDVSNGSFDHSAVGGCSIPGDNVAHILTDDDFDEVMTLTAAILHGGGAIELRCNEVSGNFQVEHASLSGVKVYSLGWRRRTGHARPVRLAVTPPWRTRF